MERFQEKLLEKGHLTLFGEIDEENVQSLVERMLYLSTARRKPAPITLWINSTGGLLQPTFALIDLFGQLETTVATIGMGTVESAASLVLMAGAKGKRSIMQNCSLMVHEYSWSNSGSFTEMSSRMKEVQHTIRKQTEFMAERTGKSKSSLKQIVKHEETWLTPEECVKWGIVDRVL